MANIAAPVTTGPSAGLGQSATAPQTTGKSPLSIGSLTDWQAAIGAFTVLFIIGDTAAAPVADVIAWGAALLYITNRVLSGGALPFANLNPGGGTSNGGT